MEWIPSWELSAETHTGNREETNEVKPLPHQRKSAAVRDQAWSLEYSGKKNSKKIAKTL